jgi:PIN domain nuclease of toxin-antitoxin system
MLAVADTHAVIWYVFDTQQLSDKANAVFERTLAEGDVIGVSSITIVELVYLTEKNKIHPDVLPEVLSRLNDPDSILVDVPMTRPIAETMATISREAIPDMPDRIIAATALHLGVPLISRDGKIQVSGIPTIW